MVRRIVFFLCAACLLGGSGFAQEPAEAPEVIFFYSPSCHVCHEVREDFLNALEQKYRGRAVFSFRDISDIGNFKELVALKRRYGRPEGSVPMVFFQGNLMAGKDEILERLPLLLEEGARQKMAPAHREAKPIDLVQVFFSFTPWAVIGAGLIDGINPCAFTVIVFFISFLALQGYRRSELVAIGLFFIGAVFLTYLLLGLGLFSFLYSMSGFWIVRTAINAAIGLMTVVLGFLAAHDAAVFVRTGRTDQMRLQLPQAVKNQIHAVIGMHYRRQDKAPRTCGPVRVFRLIVAAVVTGFLVSLLEALCTGQVYVPTISFVLKTTQIRARAWALLVLYNLMFIVPLFAIFVAALFGVTSQHFSAFLKRHFLSVKVALACMFFGLGLFLIWRG